MLTNDNKAGAIGTAMSLEISGYNPAEMNQLFTTLATKSPEYVDAFLEYIRTFNAMTFKLYCELMAYHRSTYEKAELSFKL